MKALENLFKTFFGDRTQSNESTGLVEMTSYETSHNPFYREKQLSIDETIANHEESGERSYNMQDESSPLTRPEEYVDQITPRLRPDWIE